ncbi:UDP-glycosyltransferase 89B2-like [Diospyros lotus]|uniref:UDP-glycosyltransferase 89B2-like n=1 Tax=Diospyros lotus TaxID=55363 RepID=UPI002253C4BA|nr:UDP-glycosyltransferase 89B2-like [Diospyros lotus]
MGAHVLIFPIPISSHVIPMIDLTQLLLTHGLTLTVLVTPPNLPLFEPLLQSHPSSAIQTLVLSLPESSLAPSPANALAFINSHSVLRDPIADWFKSHPTPPVAIVSDFFLGWTNDLARDLGIRRVAFWTGGAGDFSEATALFRFMPKLEGMDENSLLTIPNVPNSRKYPLWQVTPMYRGFKEGDPVCEFFRKSMLGNIESWGAMINTFAELERDYIEYLKKEMGHDRVWAVGPLLPPVDDQAAPTKRGGASSVPVEEVMGWLDSKGDDSVVYVCFGSRFALPSPQVSALAAALDSSAVSFIWVLKENEVHAIPDGFDDRVAGRGFVIKGWAPQVPILRHRAVGAFVTHCGWNSVLEGVSAGKLLLTWPLGADQFTNDRLLVDELGAAVRFCALANRAEPDSAELGRLLAESVGSGKPKERARVKELSKAATEALKGGSSSRDVAEFVKQLVEESINEGSGGHC